MAPTKAPVATEKSKVIYRYLKKQRLMTPSEGEFYNVLTEVIDGRYHLFPQVHLSAIFDHKVKGDGYVNWKASFAHINGKSVDYVLCDKETFTPVVGIELDDATHLREDRQVRDEEVERIFAEADIPLLRFANSRELQKYEIEEQLRKAITGQFI